ncbi:DUF805 domain-containing protein [Arthrobacter sp. CAN_A1]|uniref:DUF805 domain-containing protein n=1 Tax=Arthrobacter sp. CAN_A1 TaxID=2787717 RepID=UPI0018C8FE05
MAASSTSARAVPDPPLWLPHYGASPKVAVERFVRKYATTSGRASRSEFWWWVLVSGVVCSLLNILMTSGGRVYPSIGHLTAEPVVAIGYALFLLWIVATAIPSIALGIRRLHDTNESGWLLLTIAIPVVGQLVLLFLLILGPNAEGRRYDEQPLGLGVTRP